MTTFGDMVYMMGGIPAASGVPFTTGNYWWVHSGTGSASYEATTPDRPAASVDQAVNLASANDVIILMEGHTETLLNATSLVLDVAGITLWGLGHGRNRPVIVYNHANANIPVSAANIRIHNVVFLSSITAVLTGITLVAAATDFTIDECEFDWDETGDDFAIMLLGTAVIRTKILNNRFIAQDAAGCNAAIQIVGALDVEIIGNRITGDFTTSAINGITTIAHELNISFNNIRNSDTTAGLALTLFTASTGLAAHNDIGSLYSTNITAIWVNESVLCIENKAVNVVTETAGATPASAST